MNLQTSLPSGKPKTWKARYTVLTLIWLAWLLSFLDRMVMSVSLPYIGKDLNLDTTQQGLIISAFFIGYAAFQIPGGLLADKFGSRKIMAIGIAWWSVFTSLTGAVLTLPLMLAVRFFFGIGEGCFPSASWKMISTYFPSKERGRATAIQSTVNTLGPALAVVVAASIIGAFGWHMVFIVLGIPGLFIAAGIYLFTRDNPKDHPAITQQDLAELAADDQGSLQNTSAIAFKDVLKMPVLWQMASIWFLFDITFWGFSTWLPSYLITVREFSLAKTGVMAAIPFLFGAGGTLLGGYCSDKFKPQRKTLYVVTSVITSSSLKVSSSEITKDTKIKNEKELSSSLKKMNELMVPIKQTLQGFIKDPKTYTTASVAKFSLKTEELSKYENRINDYVKENGKEFKDEKLNDLYTTYQENLIDITSLISDLPKEFAD